MTASDLIDSFETLADAPGGIDHLRELVLHLAVRGRLVPQDTAEEPAYALLEHITEERQRLAEEGSLRKQKPQAPVQSQETPFDIPKSWAWARLGHYCALEMGQSPPSEFYNQDGEGLPFFQGKADFGDLNPTPRYWCTRPTKYANSGDVLLSVRAPVGPTNVATEECCIGRGIAGLRPLGGTPTMMLLWTMRAFESDLCALGTGTTFVAISKKNLEPFVLPVPPLEEQHRIVARVDELMTLLDRLEEAKEARDATRAQLRDAALAALQDANDAEEVKTAWSRIADHMKDLFTDPADIRPLRQTILQLAARGRIVPQVQEEGGAGELLKEIAEQKEELVKRKKIRRAKVPPLSPEDYPYDLPTSWRWCRLGTIALRLSYGTAKKSLDSGRVPVLRMGNLQDGRIDWTNLKYSSDDEDIEQYSLSPGSVLFNRTNSPALVGKTAIYLGERPAIFAGYLIHVDLPHGVDAEYVNIVLNTPMARAWCWRIKSDGVSQSNISGSKLATFAFPLPPAGEQRRISAQVQRLMGIVDRLESRLLGACAAQESFSASAVSLLPTESLRGDGKTLIATG